MTSIRVFVIAMRELPVEAFSMIGQVPGRHCILRKIGKRDVEGMLLAEDAAFHGKGEMESGALRRDLQVHD